MMQKTGNSLKTQNGAAGTKRKRDLWEKLKSPLMIKMIKLFPEKWRQLFYASSEKNRMLACRFGEHRDNSGNLQK